MSRTPDPVAAQTSARLYEAYLLKLRAVEEHGDEFCAAILDGKRKRDDVSGQAAA